jgi:hypothetical protein
MVLFSPISFSFSCSTTINSAGVNSSLCLTRGTFEVTVPNECGGVVTIELNTDRMTLFGSGVWFSIETMRGRCRRISACQNPLNTISFPPKSKTKDPNLIHLGDYGDQEPRVEVPLRNQSFHQRHKLRARPAVVREDCDDPQNERFRSGREISQ